MNILITGAAGYIGSLLCEKSILFLGQHKITAVDNLMYGQQHYVKDCFVRHGVEFHFLDVREKSKLLQLVKDADVIIPLAAIVGAPACDKLPELSQQVNVEQIRNIVNHLSKDQLIIYPNSNSGLGQVEGIADENTPRKAVSLYGRQKDIAEDIVRNHPNHVIFRLATVFGCSPRVRLDLLVNSMVYEAFFKRQVKVFDPQFRRNFIHVADVARALTMPIQDEYQKKMVGQVYNLGNDKCNMTKGELATLVARAFNLKVETMEGNDPDKRDYLVSSKKLYDLGYKPIFNVEEGIVELATKYTQFIGEETLHKLLTAPLRNY